MTNTPRTEQAREDYKVDVFDNPKGICFAQPVHASFARKLEEEIRQLEVTIYDLKTKNNELQQAIDEVIEDRDSYHDETNSLRQDLAELHKINKELHQETSFKDFNEGFNLGVKEMRSIYEPMLKEVAKDREMDEESID